MSRSVIIFASFLAAIASVVFLTNRQPHVTLATPAPVVDKAVQGSTISEALAMRDLNYAMGGSSGLPPDEEGQKMTRIEKNGKIYNQVLSKKYFNSKSSVVDRSYLDIAYALELTAQTDAQGSLVLADKLQSQVKMSLFIYDMVEDELVDGMVKRKVKLLKIVSKDVYRGLSALDGNREDLAILITSLKKRVPQEVVRNLEKEPTTTKLQNASRPRVHGSLVSAQAAKEQLDIGLTVYDSVKDKEKLFQLLRANDKATVKNLVRRREELISEIAAMQKTTK